MFQISAINTLEQATILFFGIVNDDGGLVAFLNATLSADEPRFLGAVGDCMWELPLQSEASVTFQSQNVIGREGY